MPLRSPAALFAAVLLLAAAALISAGPARAADFIDSAGRRLALPDHINRVMPAEADAEVLIFVLAPKKLVGPGRVAGRGKLLPRSARLSASLWSARSTPAGMAAAARQSRPELIIDAGPVTPERAAFADQVTQLTHIPYILVEGSFARMPKVIRTTGALLGVDDHAKTLWIYAEHAIAALHGHLLIRPADTRPRVYYALGADGLTTALPGSPAGAAIDEAGAINVAGPLGRGTEVAVSREQLLGWNPDIIIAEARSAYDSLQRDPGWRRLSAVRNKHVYLEPTNPFGWIEDPSGVNRLIGLYWLSNLLYPDATQEDLRATVCDFYDKFYNIQLTNTQMEAMVRPAGAPPPEASHPIEEPLIGLGAAPPSSLPPGTRGGLSAELVAPAAPGTAAAATCAVPTAPTPYLAPGTEGPGASPTDILPPGGLQGVPPPGRRGRPTAPQQ